MRFKEFLMKEGPHMDQLISSTSPKKEYHSEEEWMDAVQAAYPDLAHKIKFKGRVEGGKATLSAEIPGQDRSYGVFDQDKNVGTVLEAAGKVHTIGRAAPRGAPEEPARGLDPREKDRSILPKLAKDESTFEVQRNWGHTEWYPPETDILTPGAAYVQLYVENKLGDRVLVTLPLKYEKLELDEKDSPDLSGRNKRIIDKYKKEILKVALTALGSGVKIDGVYNGLDKNGHFTQGVMPGVAKFKKAHL